MVRLAVLPAAAGFQWMMTTVLDQLVTELAGTLGGPVGRTVLAPGAAVPADVCCVPVGQLGGQAHVRLARTFPTRSFPAPDAAWSKVPQMLAVELEIGVFRCVAGMDDDGNPPPADAVTDGAVVALDDIAALRNTAANAFPGVPVVIGTTTALGPAGYCSGTALSFIVLANPACPPGTI